MLKNNLCAAIALLGVVSSGVAGAATLAANPLTSTPAAGTTVTGVQLVSSNTTGQRGWNVTLQLPTGLTSSSATLAANATTLGALGSCTYDAGTNRVIVVAANLSTDLPSGTACTFDLIVAAGTANGTALAVEQFAAPGCVTTAAGGMCTTTVTDASAADPGTAGVSEFHVATVTAVTGPTLSPPASTTVNSSAGIIGGTSSGSIQYTAAGGNAGQTTNLSCTAPTGGFTITSGNNQNVATGATPAPIVVSITLTNAAQNGTMSCTAGGTTTNFALAAPAGAPAPVSVTPAIIPASSNWSLLAMIGVLLGVGGLALTLRRNG